MRIVVWFRGKDLRISDHEPLRIAVRDAAQTVSSEIIPLFVVDPYFFAPTRAREISHRMQFLVESLESLSRNLASIGSMLVIRRGNSTEVIPRLVNEWRVDRVLAQRWTEPFAKERDRRIQSAIGPRLELMDGETLAPTNAVRTQDDKPFRVFTPFARAFRTLVEPREPHLAPRALPTVPPDVAKTSEPLPTLREMGIARNPRILAGGEKAARTRLDDFLAGPATAYARNRDQMGIAGTSRISQDLKFGTLSPRTAWSYARALGTDTSKFQDELLWREFAYSVLGNFPSVLTQPFDARWKGFPWLGGDTSFNAWKEGKTGYPIVDAAMRQLRLEGFIHNRARMIAASFLTKHLLVDYRRGEEHFMRYLTDGDWAANNLGWQWSAGCGCDAQPYFRVFNPSLQAKRFDPDGAYVKRYVPEYENGELFQTAVRSGTKVTYPAPIVDHAEARDRFTKVASTYLRAHRVNQ